MRRRRHGAARVPGAAGRRGRESSISCADLPLGVATRAAEHRRHRNSSSVRFDLVERPRVARHDPLEQRGEERWRVEKPELAARRRPGCGSRRSPQRSPAWAVTTQFSPTKQSIDDGSRGPCRSRRSETATDVTRMCVRGLLDLVRGRHRRDAEADPRPPDSKASRSGVLLVLGRVEQVDPEDLLLAQVTVPRRPTPRSPCRGACRTGMRSASPGSDLAKASVAERVERERDQPGGDDAERVEGRTRGARSSRARRRARPRHVRCSRRLP